jgi:hypothetical protein
MQFMSASLNPCRWLCSLVVIRRLGFDNGAVIRLDFCFSIQTAFFKALHFLKVGRGQRNCIAAKNSCPVV